MQGKVSGYKSNEGKINSLTLFLTASKPQPNPRPGDKKSQYSPTPHGIALKSTENCIFIENP
jgi:hypothetical protein